MRRMCSGRCWHFRRHSSFFCCSSRRAAPNIPLLFAAEALQAPSYALYAPAIVPYVTLVVPYEDAAKGQSLAFSMTTIGGVLASLISGRLLDVLSAPATAWIAAAVCAVGAILACRGLEEPKQ